VSSGFLKFFGSVKSMGEHKETQLPAQPDSDYYEFKYPYVLPKEDVLELLGEECISKLTPLENAFVRWFIQSGNSGLAFQSLIHPAYPFDTRSFSGPKIFLRQSVKDVIKQIKKRCPFLRLYNADYIVEILHDEIQYLRHKNRKDRFYGANAQLIHYNGKKSVHEEEATDIDLLLRCLEIVQKFNTGISNATDPDAKSGDVSSSIDRVITEAKRLIDGAKISANGRVG